MSFCVQALPSSQWVVLDLGTARHCPEAGSQMPALHWSPRDVQSLPAQRSVGRQVPLEHAKPSQHGNVASQGDSAARQAFGPQVPSTETRSLGWPA